jgi:hypothetical protein
MFIENKENKKTLLYAENIEFAVPTTRRQYSFLVQRPCAPYNEFRMCIVYSN